MASGSDYDFGRAFARIENEIIDSMMRNLRRYHLDWETAEGFDWSQWQVEQLRYLEAFRAANVKKYGPRFASVNAKLEEALRHAYESGQKEEELRILEALVNTPSGPSGHLPLRGRPGSGIYGAGDAFFRVNEGKLEALLKATRNDLEWAEQAVLRRADDQYRRIIFDAQMYANTGAGTVEKAVDMATRDFLMRGIDCIVYKNGARHTIADYADMAIRTAERRAVLYGNGQKRQEWGISLVEVVMPGGFPCPQCARWRGYVLVDDVYSGGRPDGKHRLLSEAMAAGFLHPRCKDSVETFFPWEEEPEPDPIRGKELKAAEASEERENRQNHAANMAEKWERRAKYSLDDDNKRMAEARAGEWKVVANGGDSGIIRPGADDLAQLTLEQIPVTQEAIDRVPLVTPQGWSVERAERLREAHRELLTYVMNEPTGTEAAFVLDRDGKILTRVKGALNTVKVPREGGYHIVIHNHPDGLIFTVQDLASFIQRESTIVLTALGNDGTVYYIRKTRAYNAGKFRDAVISIQEQYPDMLDSPDSYVKAMEDFLHGIDRYGVQYGKKGFRPE